MEKETRGELSEESASNDSTGHSNYETALVVKDAQALRSTSGKIKKAKKLNIPLLTMEQFTARFL